MKFAKCLAVALALWLPAAAFAAASTSVVCADEASSSEELVQDGDDCLAGELVAPAPSVRAGFADHHDSRHYAGHVLEPLLPPPNASARA